MKAKDLAKRLMMCPDFDVVISCSFNDNHDEVSNISFENIGIDYIDTRNHIIEIGCDEFNGDNQ